MLIHVISGEGTLDDQAVKAGDHLLVPAGYGTIHAQGHLELITTH